jgi:hypothetical protein
VTTALAQDGTTKVNVPEALVMSMFLTRPPVILHPIAIALSLIGMAAYQVILCRPRAILYVFSMGGSLLAFLISGVSLVMEASLEAYIKSGFPAKNTTFTTTLGPVAYAIKLAFVFQLAACVVGFYTCIGGKHHCEESIRLDEEDLIVYHGAPQDFAEYARQTEKKHDYSIIEVMEKRETPADVTMEKR